MPAMNEMTKEEAAEIMERLSKLPAGTPETVVYSEKQRLRLLATLIFDKAMEDWNNGASLLRKIEQENKKSRKS